jgi:hypothetical protein
MKIIYKILFLTLLLNGCNTNEDDLDNTVTNSTLRSLLKEIIFHEDSLLRIRPTYGEIKSYNIIFSQEKHRCFVKLIAYFDVYDSHAMDGYFMYQGKYVSVYGLSSVCGENFINKKKLKYGLIPDLFDFDRNAFELAIKMKQEPPPPPPPGEPYYKIYFIASPESFIKVSDYDDLP